MKRAKIALTLLLFSSLLLASCSTGSAQDMEESIIDDDNDVLNYGIVGEEELEPVTENQYVEVDNIDIKEVTLTIDGTNAEVSMEVFGVIENRGSIAETTLPGGDFSDSLNIDTVQYTLNVYTDETTYFISYVNNECQVNILNGNDEIQNITDFTVNGAILTIPFTLQSSEESYTKGNLSADVSYMRVKISDIFNATEDDLYEGFVWLIDTVPNILEGLESYATNLALVNKPVQFNATLDPFTPGVPPYTWEWDFGDGTVIEGSGNEYQNPTHTYTNPGKYNYSVTVTDDQQSTLEDTGFIKIEGTGNGDGTPGFEILTVLLGLIAVLFFIRRR